MGFLSTIGNAIGSAAGGNLLGAATSLFGSLMGSKNNSATNDANVAIARENNSFQRKMFDDQLAFNERMWHKNNEYNTPSAQMSRYLAAGLNPYMMFGQNGGSGVSASPASGVQPPQLHTPTMQSYDPSDAFSVAGNLISDSQIKKAQTENIQADTQGKAIENTTKNARNLAEISKLMADAKSSGERARLDKIAGDLQEATFNSVVYQHRLQNMEAEERIKVQEQTRLSLELDNIFKDMRNKNYPQEFAASISKVYSEINANNAGAIRDRAQADHYAQLVLTEAERRFGFKLDNQIKDRCKKAMVSQAYSEANIKRNESIMSNIDAPEEGSWNEAYRDFIADWVDPATSSAGKVFGGNVSVVRGKHRTSSVSRSHVTSKSSSKSFNRNYGSKKK